MNTTAFLEVAIRHGEMCRKLIANDAGYGPEFGPMVAALDAYYASAETQMSNPPLAVKRAIILKFADNLDRAASLLKYLRHDGINGCYFFLHANMYHGVEDDGHIHT